MGEYLHNQYISRALIDELVSTANADLLDGLNQAQLKELIMHFVLIVKQITQK